MNNVRNGGENSLRYIYELAYDGSGNLEYVGMASPNSATSAAVWQIRKLSYSGTALQDVLYADGGNFSQVWDNRTGLSYS
jgi:hypothetical protein